LPTCLPNGPASTRCLDSLCCSLSIQTERVADAVGPLTKSTARSRGRGDIELPRCLCGHFYITTSGNFFNPALLCWVMELSIDRILITVDWPFRCQYAGCAIG
jgi:hypothetical protein